MAKKSFNELNDGQILTITNLVSKINSKTGSKFTVAQFKEFPGDEFCINGTWIFGYYLHNRKTFVVETSKENPDYKNIRSIDVPGYYNGTEPKSK